ncbi:MAG: hypothetical protein WBG08_14180 [Litorimonas sp.]
MKEKLLAIWTFAVALLLYPLAFAALLYIWWTGRSVLWGVLVLALVLYADRTWWVLGRALRNKLSRK